MDDQFTVHASGSIAIAGGAILAVGDLGRRVRRGRDHRLRRPRRDAGPGQRAHARADDAAARPRRRSAPRRLADGLHDAGRARVRPAGFRRARHQARLRGDDPVGHDLLRRHVLLRGRGRRGGGGGRHARAVRADGAQVSGARRGELRGLAGARARLHRPLEGASADRAGDRAARALHLHRGDPPGVRRAGHRVRRAAAHPPGRDRVRGRAVAARARHAGHPVGEEAAAVRRARPGRALRPRRRRRDAHAEETRAPASRTTRPAT